MRNATVLLCCAVLAACSQMGAGSAIPSSWAPAAQRPLQAPGAVGYQTLYSFTGQSSGGQPAAGLLNYKGTLYGTTTSYGDGHGTVFAISPFGKLRVIYKFRGVPDGAYPQAGLVAFNGLLYGTTSEGGVHGEGTVFAVAPSGLEQVIHSFGKAHDGADPQSGLLAVRGLLYGTTLNGGIHDRGTVFTITATGKERVLHDFYGAPLDGGHPSAGLVFVKGWFYGATRSGGKIRPGGAVFKINASGEEKVIHAFYRRGDGRNPAGTLLYDNGVLYGTTLNGGAIGGGFGTVFELTTGGAEVVLHSFGAGTDGAFPAAGLTQVKGVLYGTTSGGGISPRKSSDCISSGGTQTHGHSRCGTIFKIDRFGNETVLYRFSGDPDGANPEAPLTDAGGVLYGTTFWGGASDFYGTVFRLFP